ncbi:MAG: hypothetical protein F4X65_13830 [Chloroflexi bacterium]|nr:hypothetical protein [Chloroflexota bacterium]
MNSTMERPYNSTLFAGNGVRSLWVLTLSTLAFLLVLLGLAALSASPVSPVSPVRIEVGNSANLKEVPPPTGYQEASLRWRVAAENGFHDAISPAVAQVIATGGNHRSQ